MPSQQEPHDFAREKNRGKILGEFRAGHDFGAARGTRSFGKIKLHVGKEGDDRSLVACGAETLERLDAQLRSSGALRAGACGSDRPNAGAEPASNRSRSGEPRGRTGLGGGEQARREAGDFEFHANEARGFGDASAKNRSSQAITRQNFRHASPDIPRKQFKARGSVEQKPGEAEKHDSPEMRYKERESRRSLNATPFVANICPD